MHFRGILVILFLLIADISYGQNNTPLKCCVDFAWFYFDKNSASMSFYGKELAKAIDSEMIEHPAERIVLLGYAASDDRRAKAMKLSEERADAVKKELVRLGIAEQRITCKGFGNKSPNSPGNDADGKHLNRRVEYRFIKATVSGTPK